MEHFTTLLMYSLSVYGIAWIITKSRLFLLYRKTINYLTQRIYSTWCKKAPNKLWKTIYSCCEEFNYFSKCIVCTAAWVAVLILIFAEHINIFYGYIFAENLLDIVLWASFSVATTWIIASKIGDAD